MYWPWVQVPDNDLGRNANNLILKDAKTKIADKVINLIEIK